MDPGAQSTEPTDAGHEDGPRECPMCGSAVTADAEHFPFCSERCRMADLGRWFSGDYIISRKIEERDLEEGR